MSNWKETNLEEISSLIQYGYTESANPDPIGPKFLRITDIQDYFIDWETVPYCPISNSNYKKYKLKIGDVVIARTGNSTGATAIIKKDIDAVFASYLIRYKINDKVAYPPYIGLILKSKFWDSFVNSIKGGSAQAGANANQFGEFPILLPPLPEQKSIAAVLLSLDDKIENLRRQNQTLENIAQTLFKHWFVDQSNDDWEEVVLGDIADINAGGDKPKVFSETKTESCMIPIYSNGINNEGLYGFTNRAKITTESITISARGTIGYVCLRKEPYVPIVRLISIVPNEKFVSNKYLYLWAKSQNISGTGTTQQQLTIPAFSSTKLIIPPIDIMNKFTLSVNALFDKIQFNKHQIHTVTKTRDTLLPKLMSGEVRVPPEELC